MDDYEGSGMLDGRRVHARDVAALVLQKTNDLNAADDAEREARREDKRARRAAQRAAEEEAASRALPRLHPTTQFSDAALAATARIADRQCTHVHASGKRCTNPFRTVNPPTKAGQPVCGMCARDGRPLAGSSAQHALPPGAACAACGHAAIGGGDICEACRDLANMGFNPWRMHGGD
jgi:hypothetical protein